MSLNAQLVHESVLSVDHFLRNISAGVLTVILLDAQNSFEANEHIKKFSEKLRVFDPTYKPRIFAYCIRESKPTRALYTDVIGLLETDPENPILN